MRWVKEVFLNFRRSGFMTLISIGTIVITIAMLGGYFMIHTGINYLAKKVENKVEVVVFLHDGFEMDKWLMSLDKDIMVHGDKGIGPEESPERQN